MKTTTIVLSLIVLLALSGAPVSSASAGLPEEVLVQEAAAEAAEAAEASEEVAEDAAEAAAAKTHVISAKRLASFARRIGHWKTLIAKVREKKLELQRRPVTSKVRQIWLPRKRARLKECRMHVRLLRAELRAKEKLL
jgi:hypothetical protein